MRLGVLGGGQLGQMLALAAHPLGVRCTFLDPSPDACAGQVGDLLVGAYDDEQCLDELVRRVDAVTFEFENVPVASIAAVQERRPVAPGVRSLSQTQDRLAEKRLFERVGLAVPTWAEVSSAAGLLRALDEVGLPAVLKTRRLGYDGRGQQVIREADEAERAWAAVGAVPSILEALVPFDRELSAVVARGAAGRAEVYPAVENEHRDGILRHSLAPASPGSTPETSTAAPVTAPVTAAAGEAALAVAEDLGHVGVLALELFDVGGRLLANEVAPRVHNSGHWTIEGAETSQFENHVRVVLGLPLGPTRPIGDSVMLNVIGEAPDPAAVLAVPGAHLHLYGKQPRPGRKLGHVTLRSTSGDLASRVDVLRSLPGVG